MNARGFHDSAALSRVQCSVAQEELVELHVDQSRRKVEPAVLHTIGPEDLFDRSKNLRSLRGLVGRVPVREFPASANAIPSCARAAPCTTKPSIRLRHSRAGCIGS